MLFDVVSGMLYSLSIAVGRWVHMTIMFTLAVVVATFALQGAVFFEQRSMKELLDLLQIVVLSAGAIAAVISALADGSTQRAFSSSKAIKASSLK